MDGVRAYWDGRNLISKHGRIIHAPTFFTEGLPPVTLDGELWMGRNTFEKLRAVLNSHVGWRDVGYYIIDIPSPDPLEKRLIQMKQLPLPPHVHVVKSEVCSSMEQLDEK